VPSMTKALIMIIMILVAMIVGIVAAWVAAAEGQPRSRVLAFGGTAFAGTVAVEAGVWAAA
jgi:hypothetical protein